jgi:glycosyltransferase involved in cell wall biosynthesis
VSAVTTGKDPAGAIVVVIASPDLGSGDRRVLEVAARAAARGWSVRVATPDGPAAVAVARAGLARVAIPDVEPWAESARATAAASRRVEHGRRELQRAIAGADAALTASLDAVAALTTLEPRPKVAWLATEPLAGRRGRAQLAAVAPAIDVALTSGRVTRAGARAAALAVSDVGDDGATERADHALDALTALTNPSPAASSGDAARRAVVFAVPDFEPTTGGTTRQSRNQAEALAARGGSVTIVTQRLDASWPRIERSGAVVVERLGPMGRDPGAMKLLVVRLAWWLRRRHRATDVVQVIMYPDFVVSAWLAGLADRTVMCWAGLGDATDVLEPTGRPVRALVRAVRRRIMQRATHVALTPALRDELTGLGIEKVAVIPTPIDLDTFRPPTADERAAARRALDLTEGQLGIVYVGHLRALKRVDRLVEAVSMRVRAGVDAKLFLVGDSRADLDDRRTALHQQVARSGLEERVVFAGAVPDVRAILHAADVFVLPSDREGLSNSLLEAMACGLACVAPPSAGGDQVLDPGSGIVPPSNDARDLAAALATLDDPEHRARLGAGARRAVTAYGLASVIDRYQELYARQQERS